LINIDKLFARVIFKMILEKQIQIILLQKNNTKKKLSQFTKVWQELLWIKRIKIKIIITKIKTKTFRKLRIEKNKYYYLYRHWVVFFLS